MTSADVLPTIQPPGAEVDLGHDSGVENEQDDPQVEITHPFDPEKIKVRTVNVVVEQVVSRIRYKEIDLAPDFQRMRGIWNPQRKSSLIESLLLRIPIPVFYVAADIDEKWSVVDGVQRMSTIYDYVTGEFELTRLEYLRRLDGRRHGDLPRPMQRRIGETQLIVNIIEPGTPEEVMFNIFHRINTGGMVLNGQEIRHALNPGPVRDYLKELAETDEFAAATDRSVKSDRMADRECVLRFLAFHIDPWEQYSANDLNGYLGKVMKKINRMTEQERDALAADFRNVMRAAFEIFGDDAFRKRVSRNDSRRPISKALFETWTVQLARCSQEQVDCLVANKRKVRSHFVKLMREDQEFDKAISYSTGVPRRVQKRFRAVQQLVQEIV